MRIHLLEELLVCDKISFVCNRLRFPMIFSVFASIDKESSNFVDRDSKVDNIHTTCKNAVYTYEVQDDWIFLEYGGETLEVKQSELAKSTTLVRTNRCTRLHVFVRDTEAK